MEKRTTAILEQLVGTDWFNAVGRREGDDVRYAASWLEAVDLPGADNWSDVQLGAANRFRQRLGERAPTRLRQWNSVVVEMQHLVDPLVARKVARVIQDEDLRTVLGKAVNWDVDQLPREQRASLNWDLPAMPIVLESPTNWTILHMTMEYEYMDVNPLGFFSEVGGWYLRGHFPCGWEGSFPEGRLIVY